MITTYAHVRKCALMAIALLSVACGGASSGSDSTEKPRASAPEWFTERAKESGIVFTHFNGMSGEQYYPEIMAPGVGLLDYDNDGDLDVYLIQGAMLGSKTACCYTTTAMGRSPMGSRKVASATRVAGACRRPRRRCGGELETLGEVPQSFPTVPRKAKHGPCTQNHRGRWYSQ
jgi:hypothetical protein